MAPGTTSWTHSGPRRRAVLAGGLAITPLAALALAGCAGTSASQDAAEDDPGLALSARVARDSEALLVRYDATVAAHPPLANRLGPLRAQVAQHVKAFTVPGAPSATPAPSASATAARAAARQVPADQSQALAALAAAEQRLADARTAALRDAPPELARLLASVAACGACHVLLLQGGA